MLIYRRTEKLLTIQTILNRKTSTMNLRLAPDGRGQMHEMSPSGLKMHLRIQVTGSQLRRLTRVLKKFARSRSSWPSSILCGFGISVLVVERFQSNDREDLALYETIVAIRNRLNWNLQIEHPITPNEYITSGFNDAQARFFRDKLTHAIDKLEPLFQV